MKIAEAERAKKYEGGDHSDCGMLDKSFTLAPLISILKARVRVCVE